MTINIYLYLISNNGKELHQQKQNKQDPQKAIRKRQTRQRNATDWQIWFEEQKRSVESVTNSSPYKESSKRTINSRHIGS